MDIQPIITARGLDLTQTIAMFNPLHETDQTTFEKVATDIIGSENRDNSWLKTARMNKRKSIFPTRNTVQ